MKQCIIIGGGDVFDTEDQYYAFLEAREYDPSEKFFGRKERLSQGISHEYEVFTPQMPCKQNATYRAWKIRFEKHFPYLNSEETILIGRSLGSRFLCKWLSENNFPKKIAQLHLVSPCITAEGIEGEGSADFDFDYTSLSRLEQQCEKICIYHSQDDDIVPYAQAERLKSYLPKAELLTFDTRGHFFQPAFPELLAQMDVYKK